jgi:anaerobic ribonucleoside-triphosphate reductase activating protein
MKVYATINNTRANGPGLRTAVWLAGCDLGCDGCWNKKLWNRDAGEERDPDALAEEIVRDAAVGTEGVTLSGGDPIQQAASAYALICSIKARRPDWSIGAFSGYYLSELQNGEYAINEPNVLTTPILRRAFWEHSIKPNLDWAKLGRYDRNRPVSEMREDLPYRHAVSSANQTIYLFNNRYSFSDFPSLTLEATIDVDGLTNITGFPIRR